MLNSAAAHICSLIEGIECLPFQEWCVDHSAWNLTRAGSDKRLSLRNRTPDFKRQPYTFEKDNKTTLAVVARQTIMIPLEG